MRNSGFLKTAAFCTAAIAFLLSANASAATATFRGADTATKGSWKGVHGSDAHLIPHQSAKNPASGRLSFSGASQWVWNFNTSDPAALQKTSGTDRIAACWYAASTFAIDLDLADGKEHRLAIYCLDWDQLGRRQTITVTDGSSGALLDTQTISNFGKGTWLVWDVSGPVKLTVRAQAGNAVVNGLFLDPGESVTLPPARIAAAPNITPGGGHFTETVSVSIASATPGATIRYTTDGITAPTPASPVYSSPLRLSATTTVKARAFASGFTESAVASATFTRAEAPTPAQPPGSGTSATFITQESTTQGNWKGAYGGDGLNIPNLGGNLPGAAQVTFSGAATWVWNYNTSDLAALQKINSPERIASCWYAPSSFTIDLNLTDGQSHRVGLYCLDWDALGRQQSITVIDAETGVILSSRTLIDFKRGTWLAWDIKGHVQMIVRSFSGNAVASGLFFGPAVPNSTPAQQVAAPVITPAGGSFAGATTITISTATERATIRYTTDGSTPGTASPIYNNPLIPSTSLTVKAKAFKAGMADSTVTTATFDISNPSAPSTGLADLAQLPNRVFPSPETFDNVQYAADGKLGYIVWRDRELIFRERNLSGVWSEAVINQNGNLFKKLLSFNYSGPREDYRFQPAAVLLYDSASQPRIFQASGRTILHYVRNASGWVLTETINNLAAIGDINVLVGAAGPNNVFHLGALSAGTTRNLTYGSNRNGQWSWSVVSSVSEAPLTYLAPTYAPRWLALAADSKNNAHLAFRTALTLTYHPQGYPRAYSELRYAHNASGHWAITVAQKPDDISAEAANGMSVAIAPDDRPRIVSWYNDRGDGGSSRESRLFYHEPNAQGAWSRTAILTRPDGYVEADGPKGTGFAPMLRFDSAGRPHVLFLDHASEHGSSMGQQEYAGNLRHGWWNGSNWSFETIYRQSQPMKRQILYPTFALRGNEMAVTLVDRETKWNGAFPPISDSTYQFRFFLRTLPR